MADAIVNNFSLRIATPNGTGSMSANDIIFRALFHMGLAASVKNLFPSNIQGLPTWYQIRVSPKGYQARREHWEITAAFNPASLGQDLDDAPPGSVVVYNSDSKIQDERLNTFTCYGIPLDTLARKNISDAKLRPKLRNMIYVGAIAALFNIEHDSLKAAIGSVFKGKQKVIDLNWEACELGIHYVQENLEKADPYTLQKADQTKGKIFLDGNNAAALGGVFGGCTVVGWYPITPASSLTESMIKHFHKFRVNEDGTHNFAVVQAEDELAAVGMALGAGWNGARSMTSTSGPGISLMAENLGLGYFTEMPTVIYNIARVGPSTGLPTRTQQSDLLACAFLSHGDTRFPLFLPANLSEAFEFSWQAYDVAERLQTPVIFFGDLDLGMNTWVGDELQYPEKSFDRGKVLSQEQLEKLGDEWGRYKDLDDDGIPYRSIAGSLEDARAAYFTRGSGHDEYGRYTELDDVYARNLDRISKKIDQAPKFMPAPIEIGNPDAELGILAYGTTDAALQEIFDENPDADFAYLRVRAWPFHDHVGEFLAKHPRVLIVEQNQQGQMADLLKISYPEHAARLENCLYYGGLPLSPGFIRRELAKYFGKAL